MAIHVALLLALLGSLALALALWCWAERVAGVRPLIGFLVGVAIWIVGNELPTWLGRSAEGAGLMLLATASLTSAAFLHFTVAFTGAFAGAPRRILLPGGYVAGGAATLLSLLVVPGTYEPFAGIAYVAMPNRIGWATSIVWAVLAAAGQLVLVHAWLRRRGIERRQIGAVIASSAWGLGCMSGYAIAALHLPMTPWPLLGLPLYPVFLVYGILRYELLLANAWARRALAWTILVAVAGLVGAAVPLLPFEGFSGGRLVTAAAVGMAVLVLGGPARLVASRIVYPGGRVTEADLGSWRAVLAGSTSPDDLARHAGEILSRRLALPVQVQVGGTASAATNRPLLRCTRAETGWQTSLASGWQAAPPGPRQVAVLFGTVLAEEALRLERAAALAEAERRRQTEARLAELGALAAAVAHDLRNPLNVIGMAVAMSPTEVRAEVTAQIRRIARLTEDLLDYAKPWSVTPTRFNLADLVRTAAARHEGVAVEPALAREVAVAADPARIEQALVNLLDNACAAARRVMLDAECRPGSVLLHVCDDGPGIPPDLRERIFEPFVSRSAGGTGLGLAIVARIMTAHGGKVALTERPGWSTCFTLTFPMPA